LTQLCTKATGGVSTDANNGLIDKDYKPSA